MEKLNFKDMNEVTGGIKWESINGCVGFAASLVGLTVAGFATFGWGAVIGGLSSMAGMAASAGECERELSGGTHRTISNPRYGNLPTNLRPSHQLTR